MDIPYHWVLLKELSWWIIMDSISLARIESDGESFITNTDNEIKIFFYCKRLTWFRDGNISKIMGIIKNEMD